MTKLWSCVHPCCKFHIGRRSAVEIRSESDKEKISPAEGGENRNGYTTNGTSYPTYI